MKKINILILILIFIFFITPVLTIARIGVGVNLGKIEIDEPLKPGGIYNFPSLSVVNTGDEPGDYELEVTYHQDQKELRPPQEWFSFSPFSFRLGAGESQLVAVKLNLPVKTKPGDYFAYLEAHPVVKKQGGTTIGVAAATKAYFTVVPANIWQAIFNKISTFLDITKPYSYVVLAVIIFAAIITIFRKFFSVSVGLMRKK